MQKVGVKSVDHKHTFNFVYCHSATIACSCETRNTKSYTFHVFVFYQKYCSGHDLTLTLSYFYLEILLNTTKLQLLNSRKQRREEAAISNRSLSPWKQGKPHTFPREPDGNYMLFFFPFLFSCQYMRASLQCCSVLSL